MGDHDRDASREAAETPAPVEPAAEPAAEPATNTYEGGADALQQVRDYANGASPTASGLIVLMHQLTVAQRTELQGDTPFMEKVCTFASAEHVSVVVQALFLEPKWMLYWYVVKKSGSDKDLITRFIGIGNFQQRLEIIGWDEVGRAISGKLSNVHPGNVFGSDIRDWMLQGSNLADTACQHLWFGLWWMTTDFLDVEAIYTWMAQSADNLTTAQTTILGTSPFAYIVAHSPRGLALSEAGRTALDTCALDYTESFTVANMEEAFEVRFGTEIVPPTDPRINKTDFTLDHEKLEWLWEQCKNLPPEHVTQQMITRIAVHGDGGASHSWLLSGTNAGSMKMGQGGYTWFQGAVRHEIGHAVDIQQGGFEQFSAVCKARWKRYTKDAFLDDFIQHAANGNATLRAAAVQFYADDDADAWEDAVDQAVTDGVLVATAANVKAALPRVKAGGRVEADAKYDVNGRKFLRRYSATEFQSYLVEGEDTAGISGYAYSAYPEFFAETYEKWFDGEPPNYDRGANLPAWIVTSAFPRLVEGRDVNTLKGEDTAGAGDATPEGLSADASSGGGETATQRQH